MNSHLAHREKSVLPIYSAFFASIAFASCSDISFPFTKYFFISSNFKWLFPFDASKIRILFELQNFLSKH